MKGRQKSFEEDEDEDKKKKEEERGCSLGVLYPQTMPQTPTVLSRVLMHVSVQLYVPGLTRQHVLLCRCFGTCGIHYTAIHETAVKSLTDL